MNNENNKWKEKLENVQELEIENTLLKQRLRTILNVASISKRRNKKVLNRERNSQEKNNQANKGNER